MRNTYRHVFDVQYLKEEKENSILLKQKQLQDISILSLFFIFAVIVLNERYFLSSIFNSDINGDLFRYNSKLLHHING
jgi:hypothetical protein